VSARGAVGKDQRAGGVDAERERQRGEVGALRIGERIDSGESDGGGGCRRIERAQIRHIAVEGDALAQHRRRCLIGLAAIVEQDRRDIAAVERQRDMCRDRIGQPLGHRHDHRAASAAIEHTIAPDAAPGGEGRGQIEPAEQAFAVDGDGDFGDRAMRLDGGARLRHHRIARRRIAAQDDPSELRGVGDEQMQREGGVVHRRGDNNRGGGLDQERLFTQRRGDAEGVWRSPRSSLLIYRTGETDK
jgi:hypothetical protein